MCSNDTVNFKHVGACNDFIKDGIENCFNMNEYYRQWNNDVKKKRSKMAH